MRQIFIIFLIIFCFSFSFEQAWAKIDWIKAETKINGIQIDWSKSSLSEIESFVLVKKENECPRTIFQGEEIYRGSGKNFFDLNVENGESYCYGVGVVSLSGGFSSFVVSDLVEKKGFGDYLMNIIEKNYIIFFGPVLIVLLMIFIRIDKKRRREKELKKQIKIKNIEVDIFY
jgi:hypothetical protein